MACTQRNLSFLWTLLAFSLLLPGIGTAQGREAVLNNYEASSVMGKHLGISFSRSLENLNPDLGSGAAKVIGLDSLHEQMTNDDSEDGQDLQASNLVKNFESATRGSIHMNHDAKMGQTSSNSSKQSEQTCEYTLVIQTGNQDGAGTDSDITVLLSNNMGQKIYFRNLANGHKTFERGHKDVFVFPGLSCVPDICQMVLYTDDYGPFSEWFVVSLSFKVVETLDPATGTESILQEKKWWINEWLPKTDSSEELYTIRDDCDNTP